MSEAFVQQVSNSSLIDHRAVAAWSRLQRKRVEPQAIEALKLKQKSAVYRLVGVGPGRSDVIAKRCRLETALTERALYEEVLPQLPLPALRCRGMVREPRASFAWLFVEDAGPKVYCAESADHRALLASWLGVLHTAGARLRFERAPLPDRGADHYLGHLQSARENIRRNLRNPALSSNQAATLRGLVALCDLWQRNWTALAAICRRVPQTIAHGDIKEKNVRVRTRDHGVDLLIFDWETAGWGTPAVDLAKCPDLDIYWSLARKSWPGLRRQDIELLAKAGKVFYFFAALNWESCRLEYEWVEWPVIRLRAYGAMLASALATRSLTERRVPAAGRRFADGTLKAEDNK